MRVVLKSDKQILEEVIRLENKELNNRSEKIVEQYMVIREPGTVSEHTPSEILDRRAAFQKALLYAEKYSKTFCVVKIIGRAKIAKAILEDYED